MSYEFMRHFADSWGLLFIALVFLAVIVWALRPGASYQDHAAIPFKHDDRKDP
jgi:cytochrome c oxidase cbb3-type subunit 4